MAKVITSIPTHSNPPTPHSTDPIPVESIVLSNRDQEAKAELAVVAKVRKVLLATASSAVSKMAEFSNTLLSVYKEESNELATRMCTTLNYVIPSLLPGEQGSSASAPFLSLLEVMVKQSTLIDEYRLHIGKFRRELDSKDAIMKEIEHQMQQSKTTRVPEIALKLACIIENPTEDNRYLTSILSNLIQNNGVVSGKRWNDDTKDLFAIILDYGGPALAKIVSDRLNGPSVMTSFRRARSTWTTLTTLKEVSVERAATFYESIGYKGPFILAADATAVIPTLRIKGNTVYGLATESEVIATSAQDVIDIVRNSNIEKAKQANAFMLVPLQEHVPSFLLAISPVISSQDFLAVDTWFNNAVRWCSAKCIKLIGVGADGDSKFRKYFTQRFLKSPEQQRRGNLVTIPYESFDFVSVIEEYNNVRTPSIMFPDWRHLIKKWRNQLLNVERILFLGDQVVQLEHIIKTYEAHRLESGLWKSDIFVKDKQNVKAATRILSTSVQQCLATWNYQRTISTQTYLKIGQNMLSAFTEPNISIRERAQLAWSAASFLQLWKVWINISGLKTETSFISDQTYRDFVLAGHSIFCP